MFFLAVLTCSLIICSSADYSVKCSNNSDSSISFEPSADGVQGRYTVVWCTQVDMDVIGWDIIIRYYNSRAPERCKHYDIQHPPRPGLRHSYVSHDGKICPNFTNACLSTSVDLIFKACYLIKNMLKRELHKEESHDSFHYVNNNFTNVESLKNGSPAVNILYYEDYVSATWYLGTVPVVNFTMVICSINGTLPPEVCLDATANCTAGLYDIQCRLSPPFGNYTITLTHLEPWVYGSIAVKDQRLQFGYFGEASPPVDVTNWLAAWLAPALVALTAVAALAALLACRARLMAKLRRSVLAAWLHANESDASKLVVNGEVRVLLLYARDCAALLRVVKRLAALLQQVAPGRVYDLYSPEVSAQAASAPGEWLRAMLARDDVRVVLLQTPAAACLYGAQLQQRGDTLALERPLLGRRVVPRAPHCADALLQLALRLLNESAQRLPYRKYYIATISGLEAEVVPLVTPQRRYLLPAAAPLLLQHLRHEQHPEPRPEPETPQPQLQWLDEAVSELLAYVQQHPDYLTDELLFL